MVSGRQALPRIANRSRYRHDHRPQLLPAQTDLTEARCRPKPPGAQEAGDASNTRKEQHCKRTITSPTRARCLRRRLDGHRIATSRCTCLNHAAQNCHSTYPKRRALHSPSPGSETCRPVSLGCAARPWARPEKVADHRMSACPIGTPESRPMQSAGGVGFSVVPANTAQSVKARLERPWREHSARKDAAQASAKTGSHPRPSGKHTRRSARNRAFRFAAPMQRAPVQKSQQPPVPGARATACRAGPARRRGCTGSGRGTSQAGRTREKTGDRCAPLAPVSSGPARQGAYPWSRRSSRPVRRRARRLRAETSPRHAPSARPATAPRKRGTHPNESANIERETPYTRTPSRWAPPRSRKI